MVVPKPSKYFIINMKKLLYDFRWEGKTRKISRMHSPQSYINAKYL